MKGSKIFVFLVYRKLYLIKLAVPPTGKLHTGAIQSYQDRLSLGPRLAKNKPK